MSGPAVELWNFALSGPPLAQAPLLWDWRYATTGIGANGTFITASRPGADGYYQISSITGSRNGQAITKLEPVGDAIPGNEGYPVDNLINASGQFTSHGFGYKTADGNYANPYYANFLTPPIFQEVFTQPASGGFSEVPVDFNATIVPGVTIATDVPRHPTDTLSLVVVQAPRSGTLSLHGTSAQYVPAGNNPATPVTFSFAFKDQLGGTTPVITAIAGGNGSQQVTGAASGYTDVSLGNGNSTVVLGGNQNTVTLGNGNTTVTGHGSQNTVVVGNGNSAISFGGGGNTITAGNGNDLIVLGGSASTITLANGNDTVYGGTSDTINIAGNNSLTVFGTSEMVFLGSGNATINDHAAGMQLAIGPTAGHDVLLNFAQDPGGVIDLIGGVGGYTTVAAVLSTLHSDGHGGTLLSFGHGNYLDFAAIAPSQLHAANFRIS